MSFDGVVEETNIRTRLADLAGGRVFDDELDDEAIPVDGTGKARPYIVLSIGVPYKDPAGDASFSDGERDVPYILTLVVGCYAGDRESLNALYSAVADRLVGWNPNEGNALPMSAPRAIPSSNGASQTRPVTFGKLLALRTTINV